MEDLIQRTHELAGFVGSAAKAYDLNPGRIIAAGCSNGANIAASMLLLRPGLLAGAILFRPMVPFEPEPLHALRGTPVFIGAGRFDPLVPVPETERLTRLLEASGAEVTRAWQDSGHGLGRARGLWVIPFD